MVGLCNNLPGSFEGVVDRMKMYKGGCYSLDLKKIPKILVPKAYSSKWSYKEVVETFKRLGLRGGLLEHTFEAQTAILALSEFLCQVL